MMKNKEGICDECGKDYREIKTVCDKCGYVPQEAILNKNVHPFWKCGGCGTTIQIASPPEICPSCKVKCEFKNVTCYTPECGGPGNIDPQL